MLSLEKSETCNYKKFIQSYVNEIYEIIYRLI